MKNTYSSLALCLAISGATASTCDRSVARTWPSAGACAGNPACNDLSLIGQCNAQTYIDGGKCVKKRATSLQCTTSEICYLYTDGDLLCIDWTTGNYHDQNGGTGNSNSGVYTYANGAVTTNLGGTATTRRATATAVGAGGLTQPATTTAANAAAVATGTGTNSAQQAAATTTRPNAANDLHSGVANAAWAVAAPVLLALAV